MGRTGRAESTANSLTTTPVPVFGVRPRVYLPSVLTASRASAFSTNALLPPGSTLPSDAECAARVQRAPETRWANFTYNITRGSQRLGSDFFGGSDPRANLEIAARVTGDYAGTTDEILQWAACKWGFPVDVLRAQAAVESWWRQSAQGDWGFYPGRCPPAHGPGVDDPLDRSDECPESWGILQMRYPYHTSAWPGMSTSTAFQVDTALAVWRACYEGYEGWLNQVDRGREYAPGDAWGCVGRWYAGRWHTPPADVYIDRVASYLTNRVWEQAYFQEP